jgi:hypothetical protein
MSFGLAFERKQIARFVATQSSIDLAERRARGDVHYKSYRRWETILNIRFALVPSYFYSTCAHLNSFELDNFIM